MLPALLPSANEIFVGFVLAWILVMGTYHAVRTVLRRKRGGLAQALGLRVRALDREVLRGDAVEAVVTIPARDDLERVDVGVVCTELFDEQVAAGAEGTPGVSGTTRETTQATAHESWVPVQVRAGERRVRIPVGRETPFSYEGSCLSFSWDLVARARRRGGIDAEARAGLVVLP